MKPHYSNTNNPIDFPKSKNKMNEQIKAGADIHAGDGGYSEGTQEQYDAFVKVRNKSLAQGRIRDLAEQAGAVYSNDHAVSLLDDEIEKFAELIIRECADCVDFYTSDGNGPASDVILNHFGVEE